MKRKDAILQAALELFAEKGYHGTSTKEIAQRCGAAEGLIFYYFKGKKELLHHVIQAYSFSQAVHAKREDLDLLDGEAALLEYGRQYMDFLRSHGSYLRFIWSPELTADETATEQVGRLIEEMTELAADLFKRACADRHGIPAFTFRAGASMLLSSLLLHHRVNNRMGEWGQPEEEAYLKEIVRIILTGMPFKQAGEG